MNNITYNTNKKISAYVTINSEILAVIGNADFLYSVDPYMPGIGAEIYLSILDKLPAPIMIGKEYEGVYEWIKGAVDVNLNNGAFSNFIRTYTETQYKLRYKESLPENLLNQASNKIAITFG
ncbi:hypothetical protein Dd1591_3600 [Dickeya chrysanthemi Ech1591]|uniref:Uncharacterized protein n=2 Tax=Dickeya chrysanthemi TaxID=556 RepID=C6CKP4_DICC1|nr:hypothetical protein [Dickeya chrysanthemi]ACT08408.1 hypothetical protein Dd1591_3600 [Dickeya chrysanthemi Ech1591]